jgi:hypothetical protein
LTVPPPQAVPVPPATVAVPPSPESAAEAGKVAASGEAAKSQPAVETPPAPEPAEPTPPAKAADLAKSKPAAPPAVPAGSAGVAEKADGVLLRHNGRDWDRLVNETPLKTSDRLLCLEPFRATIDVGKIRLALVRETELRILSRPSDPVPAIELVQGRIAVRQPGSNALKVAFAKQTVNLEISSDSVVGLERFAMAAYGQPVTQPQSLAVLCQQGEVTLAVGGKPQPLKPMNVALVDPAGKVQIQAVNPDTLPSWLAQAEPTARESEMKEQFLKLFHPDRPVLTELVTAIEDDRPEIKPLAIEALKALGDLSLLMPTLSRPNDPASRRATMQVIRGYMLQGPEASGRVRAALDEEYGDENLGGVAHHMLVGYTREEAAKPDLYARLVGLLSPEQNFQGVLGVRELALDTLKRLTGRDDLGYDPDKPGAGKGFEAWNNLLQRNELRPPSPPPPRPGRSKTAR